MRVAAKRIWKELSERWQHRSFAQRANNPVPSLTERCEGSFHTTSLNSLCCAATWNAGQARVFEFGHTICGRPSAGRDPLRRASASRCIAGRELPRWEAVRAYRGRPQTARNDRTCEKPTSLRVVRRGRPGAPASPRSRPRHGMPSLRPASASSFAADPKVLAWNRPVMRARQHQSGSAADRRSSPEFRRTPLAWRCSPNAPATSPCLRAMNAHRAATP
ncbi:UNVERIFIED_ORG: hypothetical protein M2438_000183 [Methylobacterium sp. SuP10 SLI 274]|nr:hypothetical protein [Methylorubrum extorquens]MDF9861383.1 hypothetical protein [Methylorubrum pseudosasae]MDH6635008.1 hypothetical protein [Methylobacterium sp. SuP10 SLI 274]MDH6664179.1 hypothetical protein [Methylorubrum zatmanii]BDL38558.1 hypothetical protein MSPGM_11480 [Methylorubrum sp. GM97]